MFANKNALKLQWIALLVMAAPAAAAPAVVEKLDDYEVKDLFSAVNGTVEKAQVDGQNVLRWHLRTGEDAQLAIRPGHPLFARLRYFDRLQFDFRIVSGEIDSLEVRALGHVSGIRQYKQHQWAVAVLTTQRGVWHKRELDLARPNWFPWDNPDGEGREGYFLFGALAVAPDTVIELRNVRLVRSLIYLKPFYEMPITWPIKTVNPDGSVTYRMTFSVLNTGGKPTDITAQLASTHKRFAVKIEPPSVSVKACQIATFALEATMSKEDIAGASELYSEPLRVVFAPADEPDANTFFEMRLVRPLSKDVRRQVIVPASDVKLIRQRIAGGDATVKKLVDYNRVIASANKFLTVRLEHIPGGHGHVRNGLIEPWQPGDAMPEIVDPNTGRREFGTLLAQAFWKEYLAYHGTAENLGMAYLLTGDEKYARKAIDLMLLYGRQYSELDWGTGFDPPWNSGPTILTSSRTSHNTTYGTNWQLKWHCKMLSMVAESPSWTPEARDKVYKGFVLPFATELCKIPGSISNQTDISSHDLLLVGLVFDDAHIVHRATLSDAGLITRLNDIDEDGFSSEGRPLNYHFAAMREYLPAITYLENSGLKMDYAREKLLAAIRMPYRRAALNGMVPSSGDCARGQRAGMNELADYLLSIFPKEEWLADIGEKTTLSSKLRAAARKGDGPGFAKLIDTQPALFREAGMAILRTGNTPQTQIMVTLDYGRNPFHAALDRNQICLTAFGVMFTHGPGSLYNAGSGGMTRGKDKRLDSFCTHGSLGQNVILVDAQDQSRAIGRLLAWSPKPDRQFVVSRVDAIAPGVSHTRGVMLTQGLVVVLDRVESDQEHTYDFVYHDFGRLSLGPGWTASPMSQPLATTANYESIVDLAKLAGSGPVRLGWDLSDQLARDVTKAGAAASAKLGLELWQLPTGDGHEVYTGTTGMNNINTAVVPDAAPSLFHRVKGKTAQFVTVLEPTTGQTRVKSVKAADGGGVTVELTDGKTITASLDAMIREAPAEAPGK